MDIGPGPCLLAAGDLRMKRTSLICRTLSRENESFILPYIRKIQRETKIVIRYMIPSVSFGDGYRLSAKFIISFILSTSYMRKRSTSVCGRPFVFTRNQMDDQTWKSAFRGSSGVIDVYGMKNKISDNFANVRHSLANRPKLLQKSKTSSRRKE